MDETQPELPEKQDHPERSESRVRSRWIRLPLGLVLAGILLGLTELCLNVALGPPRAPVQVYSGPEQQGHWFDVQPDGHQTTFQDGPGDHGTWIPRQSTGPRVAVFGGSSVRGGSTDLMAHQEFAHLLQEKVGVEVYNLGRIALDSHDLVAIMEEMEAVEMSAWVVYTGHNDFGNTYFHQRYKGWSGGVPAHVLGGLEHLQIFWQIRSVVGMARANSTIPDPHNPYRAPGVTLAQKKQALDYLEQNLRRMVWLADHYGVELILVVPTSQLEIAPKGFGCEAPGSCAHEFYDAGRLVEARDADSIPLRAPSSAQDLVRRIAKEEGVALVDADADLPREPGKDYPATRLFMDVVHFTEYGHQSMAEIIAPALGRHRPP